MNRFDSGRALYHGSAIMNYHWILTTVAALLSLIQVAKSATYEGKWLNLSFKTAGALTIDFDLTKTRVSGVFDFDGPLFGAGDSPPVSFQAPLKADGSAEFGVTGTDLGTISGSFSKDGKLVIRITNIPSDFLTEFRIVGKFDLVRETFSGNLQIDSGATAVALGLATARVIKAPTIQMPANVNTPNSAANVIARVVVNSAITSAQATATGNARVTVVGSNPYILKVRNITLPTTRVTLTVTNRDGLKTTKTVTIRRRSLSGLLSASGFATAD